MSLVRSYAFALFLILLLSLHNGIPDSCESDSIDQLSRLENRCFDTTHISNWWSYIWCFRQEIRQVHYDESHQIVETNKLLGSYILEESRALKEVYRRNISDCDSADGTLTKRHAIVEISCCRDEKWSAMHDRFRSIAELGTFIESVTEPTQCSYLLKVCSELVCAPTNKAKKLVECASNLIFRGDNEQISDKFSNSDSFELAGPDFVDFLVDQITHIQFDKDIDGSSAISAYMSKAIQAAHLDRVRKMFNHGYDMYMLHAQPESELRPLSCDGGPFELVKIPLVTLIDTLDTLAVMGNHSEFRRAVDVVRKFFMPSAFDLDVNVSVFETTIRVLGGLLSAHLMAIDPLLGIYMIHESDDMTISSDLYDNELLYLASDLGKRLLPAFETATGIPYGTVNLRHGVPSGETEVASTAGAGSLLLEFEVLSSLLGDVRFGDAAFTAAQSLYSRRSYLGLLGKHIHTGNGQWHESTSGIGSNADSFYEYLLKGHLLFHRQGLYAMFTDTYEAVKRHVQVGDWFTEVDMFSGKSRRNRVENLQAFWPGMESIVGACNSAARLLNSFYAVWQDIGFLPEEFDQALWLNNQVINNSWYPLRPELIESTYLQYRSTGDRSWLTAGARFLDTLEAKTWTKCGYASVSNIGTMQLANSMPSYFLSETCKYLYLLFDDDNFVHDRAYVFSTEAHPFDPMQLPVRSIAPALEDSMMGKEGIPVATHTQTLLSVKCPKTLWWDCGSVAYDADYIKHQQSRRTYTTEEEQAIAEQLAIRQSIISSNSANLASLLRSLYLDAEEISHDLATVKRRENTCYDDQARQQGLPDMPLATQGQTKIASQKVSMDGGVLGLFDVTIYTDGFTVYSREQKDTIEVTNVGESFVFASYISGDPGSLSKTFIGEETGKVVTCSISLVDANGDRIEGDIDRSCSISTFGPTKFPLSPIIADLYIPEESNSRVCKPLRKIQERKATKGSESSWWRHWPSSIMLPSLSNIAQSKVLQDGTVGVIEKSIVDVAGKIVLARRGNCLFEEKTNLAQTAGASAIIIANFEDFLFVMSGMKQHDVGVTTVPGPDEPVVSRSDKVHLNIPTVMITKTASESLLRLIDASSEDVIRVRIDLTSSPSMTNTVYMGRETYPKLRVSQQVVHAIGDGLWAVVISATGNGEWQLYIMGAADAAMSMATTPWIVATPGKQLVSTSFAASMSALQVYGDMTLMKCPTRLHIDADQRPVITKPTT